MKAPRPIKAVFQVASWRQNLGRLLGWSEETSAPKNRNDKVGSRVLLGPKRWWSPSEEAYASRTEGGPERVPWGKVQERGGEEEGWSSDANWGDGGSWSQELPLTLWPCPGLCFLSPSVSADCSLAGGQSSRGPTPREAFKCLFHFLQCWLRAGCLLWSMACCLHNFCFTALSFPSALALAANFF